MWKALPSAWRKRILLFFVPFTIHLPTVFVIASVVHENARVSETTEAGLLEVLEDVGHVVPPAEQKINQWWVITSFLNVLCPWSIQWRAIILFLSSDCISCMCAICRFLPSHLPDGAPYVGWGSEESRGLHLGGTTGCGVLLRDILRVIVYSAVHFVIGFSFELFVEFLCALENRSSVFVQLTQCRFLSSPSLLDRSVLPSASKRQMSVQLFLLFSSISFRR